ncbi:MAG: phosphoribosylanthranilate isomerase [Treponema sp.]|jgi:phosphoribosylanthranilate isomerase|nr:phosphoribosylanthranilate isomerase [Treponema sp.]
MRIKICGLFREEDMDYVNEAAPDYAGFVFAPRSRRHVSPARAAGLRTKLRDGIIPVGVFVQSDIETCAALYRDGIISIIQLHGGEDPAYIARLRERCDAPLIRAVDAGAWEWNAPEKTAAASRPGKNGGGDSLLTDYLLIDNGKGGSGESFDWSVLEGFCPPRPWFLAGGIGLHNIDRALNTAAFALDISSGAESGGIKDREKILALTAKVRARRPEEGAKP